eukprot:scaffold68747_cov44-Phaeocystis_antarctica.AAC.1
MESLNDDRMPLWRTAWWRGASRATMARLPSMRSMFLVAWFRSPVEGWGATHASSGRLTSGETGCQTR